MKVRELIEKLQAMPPDSDVLFDTEAAQFRVHMVSIDSAFHEEEPRPHCGLHTKDPREYTGARDRKLAALVTAVREYIEINQTHMDPEEKFLAMCEAFDSLAAA